MERNRWETAIRCLEIAVHPNTSAEEVIAAVNGFRRTAGGMPVSRFCRESAGAGADRPIASELKDKLDRLAQENLELQRKIATIEDNRAAILRRLQEAEQAAQAISEELLAAAQRAAAAEQRLTEFRGPYGGSSGSLHPEDRDFRRTPDAVRRNLPHPIHEPVQPFQAVLHTALQRPEQAHLTAPVPAASRPWTA
jgi:hypothetical protein